MVKLELNPSHRPQDSTLPSIVSELGQITKKDTGGRRHMDVALSPFDSTGALLVDDAGRVIEWVLTRNPRNFTTSVMLILTYWADR